jgi:proteasome assembly chaperone (PAC2) family protein
MNSELKYELIEKIINNKNSEYVLADELLKIMGVDIPDLCEDKTSIDVFGETKVIQNLKDEGWECKFIGL